MTIIVFRGFSGAASRDAERPSVSNPRTGGFEAS